MKKTVIYIAGYGRSGSTLLSLALDNQPGIAALGEIAQMHKYEGKKGRECSCGRFYSECPFWSEIIKNFPEGFIEDVYQVQRQIEPWYANWNRSSSEAVKNVYSKKVSSLFQRIYSATESRVLVDASKSVYSHTWRALALSKFTSFNVFIVHLVRDVKEVVSSRKKGRNIDIELQKNTETEAKSSATGLAGWIAANTAASCIRNKLKGNSTVIRYKSLVRNPNKLIEKIINNARLEGISVSPINTELVVGHLVGSNRLVRNKNTVQIDPSYSSAPNLSRLERIGVSLMSLPFKYFWS